MIIKKETKTKNKSVTIEPKVIDKYFKRIFQGEHLHNNPTITDVEMNDSSYEEHYEFLATDFTRDELNLAILQIGRGIGLDGFDKKIVTYFPREVITMGDVLTMGLWPMV